MLILNKYIVWQTCTQQYCTVIFSEFEALGKRSFIGVCIEIVLLISITLNTLILSGLLYQTRRHLSTATILFVFNILFSNTLFVASFICLFSGLTESKFDQASKSFEHKYFEDSWFRYHSLSTNRTTMKLHRQQSYLLQKHYRHNCLNHRNSSRTWHTK